ncbi:(3R)-3-methyl-D-ornithine:L-lysine ligase pyrrolysine biosynthesis protein PylC [Methanonatronarchaeum thermophilum]|uniref:(3R)-3-methyl-D-ornithine:L-lysine ligase pyrrolysine biosynthesis protein PylC n=1 Tax=Methanonatronarchaeum thermophilum TaxID=1927129 RepID=A0A1Y3GCF6_9EURY|nr:ATP-grasp domain-containing protein [Methanonatronarchaeum thermophilum]OUJ18920.1 (3R)-3-methyl-D-ornithine:L-lysine ligase pyrrolysine biosynthesis protein PylC [Methanonatronarchaeum thermophilum]
MSVLIVGGGLQGFELCYLANKSNRNSMIVDRKANPIARSISDGFFQIDITDQFTKFREFARDFEYIVPATENQETLKLLQKKDSELKPEILFDFNSFFMMSNKKQMYNELEPFVDIPPKQTESEPPWICKPTYGSGSQGVRKVNKKQQVETIGTDYLVQKYIEGKHYSTEAISRDGETFEYVTTVLEFDESYGCCRIICTPKISTEILKEQSEIIKKITNNLNINYLFDIQTVRNNKTYLIEVNTRFPSQTPIAVYWATGINLLEEMIKPDKGFETYSKKIEVDPVVFEHFKIDDEVTNIGEIQLINSQNYRKYSFDHCEELYLGELPDGSTVGTVIFKSKSMEELEQKRSSFYSEIRKEIN